MIGHGKLTAVLALVSLTVLAHESGDSPTTAPQMPQMQSHMQTMQQQMARIRETEDPAERQRLMTEHMTAMHQGMAMMGQMMQQMIEYMSGSQAQPIEPAEEHPEEHH